MALVLQGENEVLVYVRDPVTVWKGPVAQQQHHSNSDEVLYQQLPEEGLNDMTEISYLSEASILDNLYRRFNRKRPYTATGEIVVAINPYMWLKHLYTSQVMERYSDLRDANAEPHIYAVGAEAFRGLKNLNINQSILVSGESGAGKTESVKLILDFVAHLASRQKTNERSNVISRIIDVNPLLESFGNAKTARNDNSSRFGKFTQLIFDADSMLIGSKCLTYLLEKSRVVTQSSLERSYHIFYELLAGTDPANQKRLHLAGKTIADFCYLNQGTWDTDTIEGMADGDRLVRTMTTLRETLSIPPAVIELLEEALCAVLYCGQLTVAAPSPGADTCFLDDSAGGADNELEACLALLGVDREALGEAMCYRSLEVEGSILKVPLTRLQASASKDALSKEIYSRLFNWLVMLINRSTIMQTHTSSSSQTIARTISILDIFGFESFKINRFEQLCINYANEKLQGRFTHDVFQSVQAEYQAEGVSLDAIPYVDNADVLAMIEGRNSVLSALGEECMVAKPSDNGFLSKLKAANNSLQSPHLIFIPQRPNCFTIQHYAGRVEYQADGFTDKNRDYCSPDLIKLIATSRNSLLASLFSSSSDNDKDDNLFGDSGARSLTRRTGSSFLLQETITSKFKGQLTSLMEFVQKTQVGYVRCVKPNSTKSSSEFDHLMVVQQLRSAGMIEAIKISRAAFPCKLKISDFISRFAMCTTSKSLSLAYTTSNIQTSVHAQSGNDQYSDFMTPLSSPGSSHGQQSLSLNLSHSSNSYTHREVSLISPRSMAESILAACLQWSTRSTGRISKGFVYKIGKTKVFFGGGVMEDLEKQRREALALRIIAIQSVWRRYIRRNLYLKLRAVVLLVQSLYRCHALRRAFLKKKSAAITIQARIRCRVAWTKLVRWRVASVLIQRKFQQRKARKQFLSHLEMQREKAAQLARENDLIASKAALAELQQRMADYETRLSDLQAQLDDTESENTLLSQIEQESQAAIVDLQSRLESEERRNEDLLNQVREQEIIIDDLRGQLASSLASPHDTSRSTDRSPFDRIPPSMGLTPGLDVATETEPWIAGEPSEVNERKCSVLIDAETETAQIDKLDASINTDGTRAADAFTEMDAVIIAANECSPQNVMLNETTSVHSGEHSEMSDLTSQTYSTDTAMGHGSSTSTDCEPGNEMKNNGFSVAKAVGFLTTMIPGLLIPSAADSSPPSETLVSNRDDKSLSGLSASSIAVDTKLDIYSLPHFPAHLSTISPCHSDSTKDNYVYVLCESDRDEKGRHEGSFSLDERDHHSLLDSSSSSSSSSSNDGSQGYNVFVNSIEETVSTSRSADSIETEKPQGNDNIREGHLSARSDPGSSCYTASNDAANAGCKDTKSQSSKLGTVPRQPLSNIQNTTHTSAVTLIPRMHSNIPPALSGPSAHTATDFAAHENNCSISDESSQASIASHQSQLSQTKSQSSRRAPPAVPTFAPLSPIGSNILASKASKSIPANSVVNTGSSKCTTTNLPSPIGANSEVTSPRNVGFDPRISGKPQFEPASLVQFFSPTKSGSYVAIQGSKLGLENIEFSGDSNEEISVKSNQNLSADSTTNTLKLQVAEVYNRLSRSSRIPVSTKSSDKQVHVLAQSISINRQPPGSPTGTGQSGPSPSISSRSSKCYPMSPKSPTQPRLVFEEIQLITDVNKCIDLLESKKGLGMSVFIANSRGSLVGKPTLIRKVFDTAVEGCLSLELQVMSTSLGDGGMYESQSLSSLPAKKLQFGIIAITKFQIKRGSTVPSTIASERCVVLTVTGKGDLNLVAESPRDAQALVASLKKLRKFIDTVRHAEVQIAAAGSTLDCNGEAIETSTTNPKASVDSMSGTEGPSVQSRISGKHSLPPQTPQPVLDTGSRRYGSNLPSTPISDWGSSKSSVLPSPPPLPAMIQNAVERDSFSSSKSAPAADLTDGTNTSTSTRSKPSLPHSHPPPSTYSQIHGPSPNIYGASPPMKNTLFYGAWTASK